MDRTKRNERSFAVFLAGFLAFSVPILEIFSAKGFIFGIPILLVYCFGVWLILILLIAVRAERRDRTPKTYPPHNLRKSRR
jgi:hypothetical protein